MATHMYPRVYTNTHRRVYINIPRLLFSRKKRDNALTIISRVTISCRNGITRWKSIARRWIRVYITILFSNLTTKEVEPIFLTPTRELIDFTALVEKPTIRGIRTRGYAEFRQRGWIIQEQRQITRIARINGHFDGLVAVSKRNEVGGLARSNKFIRISDNYSK